MKMPVFYNFLEDIIFLKLALLPIYYQCPKRLQSVGDAAETIHVYVLIVPEHFGGGVADETQLVLVGSRYVLKECGKGMAAAVGCVAVADDAVKRERERLELSQRQLAALVGVGKTTIGEIERGERLPNVVTAIRIAKALHTTVEELWSEDYYGQ